MSERPLLLRFVQSATAWTQLPETTAEVAFVGRSNVGKSSLINAVAGRKALALVSKTPGRTRVINLFAVEASGAGGAAGAGVVDLPGYGYAAVARTEKRGWPAMIEGYLLERPSLAMVLVLVDGEIGPTKLDVQMLEWLRANEVSHRVIATKADKVRATKSAGRRRDLSRGCQLDPTDILWVSASSGAGIEDLRRAIRLLLSS